MTTSGVTSWTLTAAEIVKAAMGSILEPDTDPEAGELTACLLRLNGLLKSWAMKGVSLYRETSATITTTPATAAVTLAAAVRDVSTARLIVSATQERPLWKTTRADYNMLPNKSTAGSPTMYYLDRQRDAAILYLWPVSATAASIVIDYDRLPETVTDGSETLDIRQELYETVWTNLAVLIGGSVFGQTAPPELVARAQALETQMLDAERPDFYRFETEYDYA